jgi:bifunctional DNA-binding transcriptional regulator/antitoxin component of YhaV-PrlF toxin-antitoxin module
VVEECHSWRCPAARKVAVGAAGRLVVPEDLRDRLGSAHGGIGETRQRDGRVEIEPALPPLQRLRLVEQVAALGIAGGSVPDALIGATIRHALGKPLTRDRRVAPTCERVGATFEVLA